MTIGASGVEWPWARRLKPVHQSEGAECGLACLAMIASWHGHKVNLPGLRQLHPTSSKGATLAELMAVASDLELAPRALRLEVDELGKLQMPAVLHWDLNHFVVIEAAGAKGVTIVDPAAGRRIIPVAELSRHFTGVALELTPTARFVPIEARTRTRLSDLWSKLVGYRSATVQILALSLLLQLTTLAMPFFLQLTVDEAIGQGDTSLLLLLLVGFAVIHLFYAVTRGLRSWVVLTLGQSLSLQLGGNVFRHLLRLPLSYFERRHVGDLLSRIGSIQPIQSILSQGLVNVLIDSGLAVTTLVVMALISVPLTVFVVATTGLYLAYGFLLFPGLRRRSEEELIARAGEETYLMESLRAIRAIKLHGHEAMRENGWRNRYADVISASYRARTYGIRLTFGENLLFAVQLLLTTYFGALAVIDQRLTIGLLLAFLAYRSSFMGSAVSLVEQAQQWRLIGLHLERLSDIVAHPREEIRVLPRPQNMEAPAIRIDGLSFAYSPTEAAILDGLSLDIPRGAFVAITGPSGAGKTTLMRLMLGLLEPTAGRIVVDGVPLGPASTGIWRARIGAVMQDDQLLTGTLADNICFFDQTPDRERIELAAKLARIHDDIVRMPMAYQSLVGDMGAALSGGQRQRIMLARALYRDPDALFLDEGTANLDEENEAAIGDMITRLPITRIVIAHRPALVARADLVFHMEGGKLVKVEQTGALVPMRTAPRTGPRSVPSF
ncbi:MAG: ATP-binding cassette, subfamily bacterial CvaB/MchF/RaxB [Sphingomonadales bacterium]|jgi:ATP-binding cassette subfamily B protein RaxB|nr:ATP-binding cassette, subfamily bacterial CvaB/MchF/RaxB [Sphingomonadales bacterium]